MARFGRRTVLGFLMFGVADAALAGAPAVSLRPVRKPSDAIKRAVKGVDALISDAKLGGKVSFVVADARTGQVLEAHNPLAGQPPASVAKAITTLFALDRLGGGKRFKTQLIATGPVQKGALAGDLVLKGGGDPTLSTDDLFKMAGRLKTAGVTSVKGKLRVYGGASVIDRIDADQPDHVGYNPAVAGLNLNFNRVYLEWKRNGGGYAVTMDARSNKIRPGVGFAKTTVEARSLPIFKYSGQGGRDNWSVASKALGKGGGRWLPVRRPEIYAGDVLQTVARSHGIQLPFPVQASSAPRGTLLVEHLSQDVRVIAKDMLRYSTNLTAEVLGLQSSGAGSLRASARAMTDWLKTRHGVRKAKFVDHSGLGDASQISAQEMVKALVGAGAKGELRSILKPIAVRDENNKVVQNSPTKVVAKTGTLNFVSALAGYVRTPDGRDLAFAIFMADVPRRRALKKSEREAPRGSRSWNGRAKKLQAQLINRWAVLHGT
ncbi:D-alanyl-D-alanine carboxypeptidase/D-alanyl-D-alanine-endopeptidase (penicillin-binding protein 4) [Litoreibacter meonggei]|uniref:D-alanyl-D-alanine carboxypeptidase/D-alanyl-D-alanine-endopeptidase (Penicillin-binding protein 4) n=1 Tax=Litoreibacter meonggei TaxID=1049199 RepID=A0A497WKR0_9RHOB|nr:D-alanyl-D-alanine carboxypeptidase/D-alanyl-D-alanine-endopeptidase [Litoreibacter meonggei]RLJ51675.1 D-alanyl-D-alanine carboxypeptidase/D-alanyl-D-alanine-endopeptidase (penicillin-binding protein 4) [Litoreibacter meonggei]